MKKITVLVLALLLLVLTGCGGEPKQEPKKEAAPPAKAEKQTLNVYSWADYFDPEVLEAFEKENNCKVNYDVFANNEELLAKLQAGGSNYDVIMPSDYMVTAMIKLNLLDKLDPQKIPNITKLRKGLTKQSYDPTGEYSVVYTWGVTGIVYNKKYVKTPPTQWEDLWKPEYKGRVVLLNDNREVIGMALKKAGKSNNSTDPAEVKAAVDDLRKLMPNVLAFDSETIRQKFIAEEAWIGTMWSGDATFSRKDNPDLEYMIPQQGATVWADTLAIPKGTPRRPKSSSTTCTMKR